MAPSVQRPSGLNHLGSVPWGTHFCHLYESDTGLYNIVLPFLEAGLRHNEYCVWITPQYLEKETAIGVLREGILRFEQIGQQEERAQLHIIGSDEWYLANGQFDPQEIFREALKRIFEAESDGFEGVRITGDAFWVLGKNEWTDFTQYEATINSMIREEKVIALCTYPALAVTANEISHIAKHHHAAFMSRAESVEAIEFREVERARPRFTQEP
jgi:hypothetical protein